LHIFEDHFFPEIIDPQSGTVLPDGEEGELVLTTLSKEAMPLIRYRTGDITKLLPDSCGCGRTLRRVERIHRRSDDMLIVRGVNVYPAQIEAALLSVKGTLPHYQIELTRQDDLDQVAVHVEVDAEFAVNDQNPLHAEVTQAMKKAVGLRVEVQLLNPQALPRSEGKAKRVIDRRFE
jgi:phenylacetate-CoA ligase